MALFCVSCGTKASNEELYANAVEDAKECEAGEISELLELSDGENLLISWNNSPDEFEVGGTYTPHASLEIWCTSYDELKQWYAENCEGVTDWTERLEE